MNKMKTKLVSNYKAYFLFYRDLHGLDLDSVQGCLGYSLFTNPTVIRFQNTGFLLFNILKEISIYISGHIWNRFKKQVSDNIKHTVSNHGRNIS
jgi:hypothetical protein